MELSAEQRALGFPVKMTKESVIAAAATAYKAKKLSAQGPAPAARYRDALGLPCAIGASFTDAQAAPFYYKGYNDLGVCILKADGFLSSDDPGFLSFANKLQRAHDGWVLMLNTGPADGAKGAETAFARMLGVEVNP